MRIRARDASARLGEVPTKSGLLKIPNFLPVYNPNKPLISPREMREVGIEALITNSYIIYKNPSLRDKALSEGLHRMLSFDGVVMTDSGAYQLYRYGEVEISNEDIIKFQHEIGSDIASILDTPMSSEVGRRKAELLVSTTIKHAEEWGKLSNEVEGTLWVGTPQGGLYKDLVEKSAKKISELGFQYYGVGSIKGALERYDFWMQADHFLFVRSFLQPDRPIHFWGIGHPATFSFFVAIGADTFDSASYALYAEDERYMTTDGTLKLSDLEEFPCSCPVCIRRTPQDLREMDREERVRLLALHNLYVCIKEIRTIRSAIKEGWLWNLVQRRARFHPYLLHALRKTLEVYSHLLSEREPFTKRRAVMYLGEESRLRPDVRSAIRRIRGIEGRSFRTELYGDVPLGLKYAFPFGQTVYLEESEIPQEPEDEEIVSALLQYQFGKEASRILSLGELRLNRSRRTGMPRDVFLSDVRIGFIRPEDGLFVLSLDGARLLVKVLPFPKGRVVVKEQFEDTVARGTTVFSHFVEDGDPDIRPYQEVIVVSKEDQVLATGKTILSLREARFFHKHPFVKIRHHALSRSE